MLKIAGKLGTIKYSTFNALNKEGKKRLITILFSKIFKILGNCFKNSAFLSLSFNSKCSMKFNAFNLGSLNHLLSINSLIFGRLFGSFIKHFLINSLSSISKFKREYSLSIFE